MIPNIVAKAIADAKEWVESQVEDNEHQKLNITTPCRSHSLEELLCLPHSFFCLVDSSWKSANKKAGIGWKLVDKEGYAVMIGSSSIDPIASSLEAEAFALRDTVQQVKRHGYNNFGFAGDSQVVYTSLIKSLNGTVEGR